MAHFIFLLRARRLAKVANQYKEEKAKGLAGEGIQTEEELENELDKDIPEEPAKKSKNFLKVFWEKFKGSRSHRYLLRFRNKKSKEYTCLKSFFGFLGGVLLTYVFFFFFLFGFRFTLRSTTYICMLAGIIFCLGLAFSRKIRCYVLLMIPVFFSKEGRQVLMAYAFFLALTGPGRNLMHNMGILSDSMACGQDMIRRTMIQIIEMVKTPLRAVKETLSKIAKVLKAVIAKIKAFFDNIKRIILGILHVIKKAVSWLGNIVSFCNKKIGTPFQRCMKTFEDAITDCKAKMGIMDFLCYIVHVVKPLCYAVKFLDLICLFTEFVSENIIGVVKRKLREFGLQVKNMFYVSIEYSHSYEFQVEASNSTRMIAQTIFKELTEKVDKVTKFLHSIGWVLSFLFIFIFFRVLYYRYRYLSSDHYDNQYINKYIVELDMRRAKMDRETVLPLELRERKHYCRPTAIRLLLSEQESILKSMLMLSLTTIKIVIFIASDYCFYWVLFTIYEQGHREYAKVQAAEMELQVSGKGSIADIYKSIGKSLKVPEKPDLDIDPVRCLPDPLPPDKDRYIQIGYLLLVCWFLTVTEAYGLRLRNIVMSHYYPERARERAVWLYNHILRSRGNFLKFARRQLRRKLKGSAGDPTEAVTFTERLYARFPILERLMGKSHEKFCLLCGAKGTEEEPLRQCYTPNCPGIYCPSCYAKLNNICTICQHPMEYGDLSDISEERDSSEESLNSRAVTPLAEAELSDGQETTFRDMETRPSFRDVEKNQTVDYAQKSDFDDKDPGKGDEGARLPPENYKVVRNRVSYLLGLRKQQQAERIRARRKAIIETLRKKVEEERMKLAQTAETKEEWMESPPATEGEEEARVESSPATEEEEEGSPPTRKQRFIEILNKKAQEERLRKAQEAYGARKKAFIETLNKKAQEERLRKAQEAYGARKKAFIAKMKQKVWEEKLKRGHAEGEGQEESPLIAEEEPEVSTPVRKRAFMESLKKRIQEERLKRAHATEEPKQELKMSSPREGYNAMVNKVEQLTKKLKQKSLLHLYKKKEAANEDEAKEPLLGKEDQKEEVTYRKLKRHVKSRMNVMKGKMMSMRRKPKDLEEEAGRVHNEETPAIPDRERRPYSNVFTNRSNQSLPSLRYSSPDRAYNVRYSSVEFDNEWRTFYYHVERDGRKREEDRCGNTATVSGGYRTIEKLSWDK